MWNLFNCYLSGRHDYGMWCEPGAIFLRCVNCGKRSSWWSVDATASVTAPLPKLARARAVVAHVLPFGRSAARQPRS